MATAILPHLPSIYRRIQISAAEQAVLVVLATLANIQGYGAKIALEALAQRTGYTVKWVTILLGRLEDRHLLRVHRTQIGCAWHGVNKYDLVQPWRREITYEDALRKRQQQHRDRLASSTELRVQSGETQKEIPLLPPMPMTPERLLDLGLTKDSWAYRAALGLPTEEHT